MVRRVTFDTNVLDLACRPERFPKDPRQPLMQKVHNALVTGQIDGFYSVTMLTIEGIQRRDRAEVFSNTRIVTQPTSSHITKNADLPPAIRAKIGGGDVETISLEFRVEQNGRKPLHPEVIARMQAAKALGVKVLKAVPRMAAFHITDPAEEYYLSTGQGTALQAWIASAQGVSAAIQARGVGMAQLISLGNKLGKTDPASIWFHALDEAADIHQKHAVERAFGEWADGDSVASHVAYGLDIFCSADVGNSNATNSVLDPMNRAWLSTTYGVQFMTFEQLAASL